MMAMTGQNEVVARQAHEYAEVLEQRKTALRKLSQVTDDVLGSLETGSVSSLGVLLEMRNEACAAIPRMPENIDTELIRNSFAALGQLVTIQWDAIGELAGMVAALEEEVRDLSEDALRKQQECERLARRRMDEARKSLAEVHRQREASRKQKLSGSAAPTPKFLDTQQ